MLEDQPEWINLTLEQKHDAIVALVGPKQRHSLAKVYVLTTYYGCLILVGVFGNLLTSWVISKSLVLQTPPNFYIFNLAIVDLITLLLGKYNCKGLKFWLLFVFIISKTLALRFILRHFFSVLPMEIVLIWHSYPWYLGRAGCVVAVILGELVTYLSVGTMIAFTVER